MKVLGVIVEYNPLHFGHLYHLESSVKLVHPDYVVAVMSGNFVQRGEPAIVDKFARTEMALKSGIDVVLELPTIFAIQDASAFAYGSIGVLDSLNVVNDIVFGSETDNLKALNEISRVIVEEPDLYRKKLKLHLKEGLSFPNARRFAIKEAMPQLNPDDIKYSNNILGLEYIVSLRKWNSTIKAHTIQRIGSAYNDTKMKSVSSATAIRKHIEEKNEISGVPPLCEEILRREFRRANGPVFLKDLFESIKLKILTYKRNGLEKLYGFNEGMAQRMVKCVNSNDLQEFLSCVKTKRFTLTRIKRRLLYVLFDLSRELVLDSNEYGPQYVRLLGFKKEAARLLRRISDVSRIPLVTNVSKFDKMIENRSTYDSLAREQMKLDLKAGDVYAFFTDEKFGKDFRKPVIV